MKIAIIVHSFTGHTLEVANKLKVSLETKGHQVVLDQVNAVSNDPNHNKPTLINAPSIEGYDLLYFCSPVQAFSLARIMTSYLKQLPVIKETKARCIITKYLKQQWLGGNSAIRKMESILKTKNIICEKSGVVVWKSEEREQLIEELCASMSEV